MTTKTVQRNKRWCLVFQAIYAGGGWGAAVIVAYYEAYGLSQLQIHLLQTTWALVVAVFGTPCGYLADRIGIRRILMLAGALQASQTALFIQCDTFWQMEFALALGGIVTSLTGGATNALMTVTLRESLGDNIDTREELFRQYQRQMLVTVYVTAAITMIIGSILAAKWGPLVPYICRLTLEPLLVIAAWRCIETKRGGEGLPPAFNAMRKSVQLLLVDRPDTRWIIILDVLLYIMTIGAFWLLQPRLVEVGVPLALFGVILATRTALPSVLVGLKFVHWTQKVSTMKAWTIVVFALATSLIAIGLPTGLFGIATCLLGLSVAMACRSVLLNDYLHHSLADDSLRTTQLSVVGAVETLVFAITIPLWGWLKDITSAQTAFLVLGVTCMSIGSLSLFRLRRALSL